MATVQDATATPLTTAFWGDQQDQLDSTSIETDPVGLGTNVTGWPYVAPAWTGVPLLVAAVLGVAGNLTVIVVVSCSRRLHVPFYLVLMSLAVGDLLKALTVGPLAVLRLALGGALPWWVCWLAERLNLGYVCLTLSHITVALLHVHLTMRGTLRFRRLSNSCIVSVQLTVAWVLPVVLSIPHLIIYTGGLSPLICRPLDARYFSTGVLPVLVVPTIMALIVYVRVVVTIRRQRRVAKRMQTDEQNSHSETSSNGFVTYENSLTSEDGVLGHPSPQMPPRQHVQRDVIVHGVAAEAYGVANCGEEDVDNNREQRFLPEHGAMAAGLEERGVTGQEKGDDNHVDPILGEESKGENRAVPPSREEEYNEKSEGVGAEGIACDYDEPEDGDQSSSPSDASTEITHHIGEKPAAGNNPEPDTVEASARSVPEEVVDVAGTKVGSEYVGEAGVTSPGEANVVHVKTKVGKEALNEPLDGSYVNLQLASFLNSHLNLAAGIDNPTFNLEDESDTPLADSIKARPLPEELERDGGSPGSVSRQGLQISANKSSSDSSPRGISRTSSMSGDDSVSGHRSILKRSRTKRDSKKSVKFDLPGGEADQLASTKPRLLSCKYRTKRGNNAKGVAHTQKTSRMEPGATIDVGATLRRVNESPAKSANIQYLVQAQRDHGSRLMVRIKRQAGHGQLLLAMLAVCVMCVCPYMGMLVGLSFGDLPTGWTEPILLISGLECLGVLPFITYPVLYLIFSVEFRKALMAMSANN